MTESETQKMNDKTKIDDGDSVYPAVHGETETYDKGITRRDWLAGLAMQAIISNYTTWFEECPERQEHNVISESYRLADSMIAEGRKGE